MRELSEGLGQPTHRQDTACQEGDWPFLLLDTCEMLSFLHWGHLRGIHQGQPRGILKQVI